MMYDLIWNQKSNDFKCKRKYMRKKRLLRRSFLLPTCAAQETSKALYKSNKKPLYGG